MPTGSIATGQVGSYLGVGAWALLVVSLVLGISAFSGTSFGAAVSAMAVGLILWGSLWLGGLICEGIGWIATKGLYGGLAGVVGWATCMLAPLHLLLMMLVPQEIEIMLGAQLMVGVLYNVLLLVFWLSRRAPGRVVAAMGSVVVIAASVGFWLGVSAERDGQWLALGCLFGMAAGRVIKHLASAQYFKAAGVEARAINTI